MKPSTSKQLHFKSRAKHYRLIEPWSRIANLLPWSINDGERCVQVATRTLPERKLPLRRLGHSPIEVTLQNDLRKAAVRRKLPELVKDLL